MRAKITGPKFFMMYGVAAILLAIWQLRVWHWWGFSTYMGLGCGLLAASAVGMISKNPRDEMDTMIEEVKRRIE